MNRTHRRRRHCSAVQSVEASTTHAGGERARVLRRYEQAGCVVPNPLDRKGLKVKYVFARSMPLLTGVLAVAKKVPRVDRACSECTGDAERQPGEQRVGGPDPRRCECCRLSIKSHFMSREGLHGTSHQPGNRRETAGNSSAVVCPGLELATSRVGVSWTCAVLRSGVTMMPHNQL